MLDISHLSHAYGGREILRDVSLRAEAGALTCLVGPSGCGKSTLLRLIAGLEEVQHGEIRHHHLLASATKHTPAQERNIGLVFQHPSLFPHITVERNIRFGLAHLPRAQQQERAAAMMQLIGLEGYGAYYPHQLSGGQHQRVALARTLAPQPVIMLLDEPFANLDHALRRDIREEVMEQLKDAHIPIIMVTHDPEEALVMADHVVLLNTRGHIHQAGTADRLHNAPIDLEAARFFGHINEIEGVVRGDMIHSKLGTLESERYAAHLPDGTPVVVATRPEGIRIARAGEACVEAVIDRVAHTGAGWLVSAHLPEGRTIRFHHIYGQRPHKGEHVCVTYEPPHIFVFERTQSATSHAQP